MSVHGTVHWTELNTHDAEKAMKFYGEVMGWTFDGMPMGNGVTYYLCVADGETVAGIFTMDDPMFANVPEHWFSYFAVDDVDALVEKAKRAGATIIREPFDVPGTGRVAIVQSPSGSVCGWMMPTTMLAGDNPGEMEFGIHD